MEGLIRTAGTAKDRNVLGNLGGILLTMGEPEAGLEYLRQSLGLEDATTQAEEFGTVLYLRPRDLAQLGMTLWVLGYPDQARAAIDEAIAHAKALGHPPTLAITLIHGSTLARILRRPQLARERAQMVIQLAREQKLPFFETHGEIYAGSASIFEGRVEEGTEQLTRGMAAAEEMSARNGRSSWLLTLARAHGLLGRVERGLEITEEAGEFVERSGARADEPWVHASRAWLLTRRRSGADLDEVEFHLRRGIEIARTQSARMATLILTIALARVYKPRGRREEARETLAEIYGWFTEGFDTADLKDAKALLEELS
jgi:adenylate cyclase